MINTYRYGGHKDLREDNTTQKLEVRPGKILEIKGPFIQVTITHPVEIQEERRGQANYALSLPKKMEPQITQITQIFFLYLTFNAFAL